MDLNTVDKNYLQRKEKRLLPYLRIHDLNSWLDDQS